MPCSAHDLLDQLLVDDLSEVLGELRSYPARTIGSRESWWISVIMSVSQARRMARSLEAWSANGRSPTEPRTEADRPAWRRLPSYSEPPIRRA